jgi:hypothetical protein
VGERAAADPSGERTVSDQNPPVTQEDVGFESDRPLSESIPSDKAGEANPEFSRIKERGSGRRRKPIRLFMTGLPNAGKSTFVASLPVLFGDNFEPLPSSRHDFEFDYAERVRNPRATYKPIRLSFNIKKLVKARYDRTFTLTDDGGEWLEPAMDRLGGQDEGSIEKKRLHEIRSELQSAHGFMYLVPWDDLISPDTDRRQHISESFRAFVLALKRRFASPKVAIVVTRCDLEDNVLTEDSTHFTNSFRDRVTEQIKQVLEPRYLNSVGYKVFPISSLGFNNVGRTDDTGNQVHIPRERMHPIGGREVIRWLAGQHSVRSTGKATKVVAGVFLVVIAAAVGVVRFVQPRPVTEAVRLQSEFDKELEQSLVGDTVVDEMADSIAGITATKGKWSRQFESSNVVTEDERIKFNEYAANQVKDAVSELRQSLYQLAIADIEKLGATGIDLDGVRSAFELLPHVSKGLQDQGQIDEVTNEALKLAGRYMGTKDHDLDGLADILAMQSVSIDHPIKKLLMEIRNTQGQNWHTAWREELRSTISKHGDPVARFEQIRDVAGQQDKESKHFTNLSQELLDEPRRVHAYAEFMVGPKNPMPGQKPFSRTVILDEIKITGYEHPDVKLAVYLQIAGQPPIRWWSDGPKFLKKGGDTIRFGEQKPVTVDWQPGQDVYVELMDKDRNEGIFSSGHDVQLLTLNGTSRYFRGGEIHVLNLKQGWSKVDGGREVYVRLKVNGLPDCPSVLQDMLEPVNASSGRP